MTDPDKAIAELGFGGQQGEHMVVVENTPAVHNMVVCTLCSCYPWPVLGLPPVWYKSAPYRSRSVIDPRGVLREFGLELSEDVEVRVWDSTAELRYLVLPERPAGTEALTEGALAAMVTRDSMIGVAKVASTAGRRRGMNGVHDMGGMQDMGPIQEEKNEPVFHHPWEGRVFAITRAMAAWRKWNLDAAASPARADSAGRISAHELLREMAHRASRTFREAWFGDARGNREREAGGGIAQANAGAHR